MTWQEWLEIRDILLEKTDRFDEMGFPDIDGEYGIDGFPLPIT